MPLELSTSDVASGVTSVSGGYSGAGGRVLDAMGTALQSPVRVILALVIQASPGTAAG